ncbi:MAG: integrin alpha [Chloroflexota bacterium]
MNTHSMNYQLAQWLFVGFLLGVFLSAAPATHIQTPSAGADGADPAGLSETPNWTAESDQDYANFGVSVASAGDVNGDGYSDVIVGANYSGRAFPGRVHVYHGSATGLSPTANWTAEGDQEWSGFGFSVATAGNVNGDGYDDVIVGAYAYDNGQIDEGRAYVYYGSAGGLSPTANWTAEGDQHGGPFGLCVCFGYSVSTAGDVNGDGYDDVVIGAYLYNNDQMDEGRVFVYHGSLNGLSLTPSWTAESDQSGSFFGASVGTAGDVNGDGYGDVIVGADSYSNGQNSEGRAFVYYGSSVGLSLAPNWTAESDQSWADFGYSVGTAGDVNSDGFDDVIVGAIGYDNGQSYEGRAYVYHGSTTGLSLTNNWTAESDQGNAYFGRSVGAADDVNGDGYGDVIVGAYLYDNGQNGEGRAYVYHGSPAGLNLIANWTTESDQASAEFGFAVATAGNVNGDSYQDVIVSARFYSNDQVGEGRAYVYHGHTDLPPRLYLPVMFNIRPAIQEMEVRER